ncbi:Pecanex-Like Protein 1, partial [Manis pentadactyla]
RRQRSRGKEEKGGRRWRSPLGAGVLEEAAQSRKGGERRTEMALASRRWCSG